MTADNANESTLASLAYINVSWETSRTSYLDNFVPLALEALRLSGTAVDDQRIADVIRERFGLDFPAGVIGSVVGRAVRKRQVRRLPGGKVELVPGVAESLPDLVVRQAECRRKQNHLLAGLVRLAADRFGETWTESEADTALVEYIESHVVPLLALSVKGRASARSDDTAQGRGYVVAAFISDLEERDPDGFAYLDEMVKGAMLAAALYLKVPGDVNRRFKKTTLYLDTAICLRVLGHEGGEAQQAVQQMLTLACAQGAELACFEHTVREMRGILEGAKYSIRAMPGSETAVRGVAAHFRSSGYTASDVDLAVAKLESDLKRRRISVVSSPPYAEQFCVDENALETVLQDRVGYKKDSARIADLKSLTAVHRHRRGESGPYLEQCGAVLVTNNANVVKASRAFFNSGRHEWPIAMLDHDLAALVWVKAPTAAPDLPRRQVIADCYAAMSPSASMWSKITDEIDRLSKRGDVTPEDVALLRYSHEAERSLMDATTGDPRRVDAGAIKAALALARSAAAAPAEQSLKIALDRVRDVEQRSAQHELAATEAVDENESLKRRVRSLEDGNLRRESDIRTRAARRVRRLERVLIAVAGVLVVGSVLAGAVSLFPAVGAALPTPAVWVVRALGLIGLILGGWGLWNGQSVKGWVSTTTVRWTEAWTQRALRKAGLFDDMPVTETRIAA